MIWEQKSATIVMLTNLKERKEVSPRLVENTFLFAAGTWGRGGCLPLPFLFLSLLITAEEKKREKKKTHRPRLTALLK